MSNATHTEGRVAVLVDCDNVSPDIVDHALLMAAQFGRVVLRRGYGNPGTLNNRWQETLVRQAFTPHLQYQYAAGKNTADIALALDALEAMFDDRADTFCLVTSDSDFAYLCRKLRERGATVCIVGETKTPDALRNASDQFFEWVRDATAIDPTGETAEKVSPRADYPLKADVQKTDAAKPIAKRRPRFVAEAVGLLAGSAADGQIPVGALGQYLKRTDPAFSPKTYGHSGLVDMLKTYDLLSLRREAGGNWWVGLSPNSETPSASGGSAPTPTPPASPGA